MKRSLLKSAIISIGILISFSLNAAVIQIDFASVGDSGIANPGGNWNIIANANRNATTSNLIDINSGSSTGIDVTGAGFTSFSFSPSGPGGFSPQKDWVDTNASQDSFLVENGTATLTFSNLPNAPARLEVVSSGEFNTTTALTANGAAAPDNFDGDAGLDSSNFNESTQTYTPGNWLIWDSITPVGGEIVISLSDNSGVGNGADINAIRLATVPEPGTYVMFATIIIGAFYMKLRSRKNEEETVAVKA